MLLLIGEDMPDEIAGSGIVSRSRGIGSRMPRQRQSPDPPEFLAGTPVYMSPCARRFGSHSDYGIADTLVQFPRSDASDVIGQVTSKYTRSLGCAQMPDPALSV
jgi:hypothetical protein